jgi:hypothetical protein
MSCLTTTEKAKAIVGPLIDELNRIKRGDEKKENIWISIMMIVKSYEDKELANIGCIAGIAEWYNLYNEDTKENQALLLNILSYYYNINIKCNLFCLECPHCKPLREKGIHKKTLIKRWIKQVRHEKCACGNALIWEAYCSKSGLDEEYFRDSKIPNSSCLMSAAKKIFDSHNLLIKGVKYHLEQDKDE